MQDCAKTKEHKYQAPGTGSEKKMRIITHRARRKKGKISNHVSTSERLYNALMQALHSIEPLSSHEPQINRLTTRNAIARDRHTHKVLSPLFPTLTGELPGSGVTNLHSRSRHQHQNRVIVVRGHINSVDAYDRSISQDVPAGVYRYDCGLN